MTASAVGTRKTAANAWLLSSPALVLVAVIALLPSLVLLFQAFRTVDGTAFTTEHFERLMDSRLAAQAFWRTLRVALATTILTILGGYPLAMLIARSRAGFSGLMLAVVIFPLMVSVVVRAFGWIVILGPSGIVNQTLMSVGIIEAPLQMIHNEIGIIIGETQLLLPYMVLSLLAVLQKVDPHLEEAAKSLGANPIVTFFRVTLPVTIPGLLSGVLLVFSLAITAFATPLILGGARAPLLTTLLYRYVFSTYDWAAAAAVAVVLALIAIAFVTLQRVLAQMWMKAHG